MSPELWQANANVLPSVQRAAQCPRLHRGNAHGTGKSQSHAAENPARVANVLSQRSRRRLLWRPIRCPLEIAAAPSFACTLRPSSLDAPVLRNRTPQQQTVCARRDSRSDGPQRHVFWPATANNDTAARRHHSGQTVARPSQSHRAHVAISPPRSLQSSKRSAAPAVPNRCPAARPCPLRVQSVASRCCCASRLSSSCHAALFPPLATLLSRLRLRSIQRQHDAMQLSPPSASKLLIVMPGPARTWTRRVRVRRSEQPALFRRNVSARWSLCAITSNSVPSRAHPAERT